ncbi:MAG: pilus assembly protein PilM [Eubacterium sp.]|nr:pilus assembly protein PilM [Eubacterium sp.]
MSSNTVLGIDIGSDRLKLALVSNGRVMKTAYADMPENLIQDSRFISVETMATLISQTMKESGIRAGSAAVILPGDLVYVKNVDVPLMTEEQLAYNLPFEFNDYITSEVENYAFDYAVIDRDEENLHLLAVGVEKSLVEELETVLRKAGLRLVKTAPALCTYISLIRSRIDTLKQVTDEFGILDLGYSSITMYMYKGDQYIATRAFDMGLSQLDDIIADKYGVEKHLAHTYVLNDFENCLSSEECRSFYDNLAVELTRAINFYQFSNQGSVLDNLWLCGGGAANQALVSTLDETVDADLHNASELVPDGERINECNTFVQAVGITLEI